MENFIHISNLSVIEEKNKKENKKKEGKNK